MTDFTSPDIVDMSWVPENSMIKVIGVGGGGCNAVTYMYKQKIQGCNFIVCNTDSQALQKSEVPIKIQLGEGLGAGTNPTKGRNAALESQDIVAEKVLDNGTQMLFITAGMGGGTGTGAAPVFAKAARESGALVIAVVTTPFTFEGRKRTENAVRGLKELKKYADNIVIVSNNRIIDIYGRAPFTETLLRANEIITQAILSITNLVSTSSIINVDFADIKAVLKSDTNAFISMGTCEGDNAAEEATYNALNSPLQENGITGAKNAIISVTGGRNLSLVDAMKVIDTVKHVSGDDMEVIFGVTLNEAYDDLVSVTIVATGVDDIAMLSEEDGADMQEERLILPAQQTNNPSASEAGLACA
jgi:cell division protein FtsZ